jgi:PKD repeat protein
MIVKNVVIIFSLAFYFSIQACVKKPFACFRADVPEDSIRTNQLVTFNALCSSNAADYFWEFYDHTDSVNFSQTVQKTFYDTGQVKVFLMVTNGNKQSSITRTIRINP